MKYLLFFSISLSIIHTKLISPVNLDTLSKTHILFEWEQEPYAVGYNLQISNSNIFDDFIVDSNIYNLIYIDQQNLDWDNTYYWRIKSIFEDNSFSDWIDISSFYISNSLFTTVTGEIEIYNEGLIEEELTIFGGWYSGMSIAFDGYGKEVWNSSNSQKFLTNIDDYGRMYGFSNNNIAIKFNFDNDMLYESDQGWNRHELIEFSNSYFVFEDVYEMGPIPLGPWTELYQDLGYVADGETIELPWRVQNIIQIDDYENQVWEWRAFDYFDMNYYDSLGGTWFNALQSNWTNYDFHHSNSIYFDENESAIYLSVRHLSQIVKIDYPSGEILWKIGLPDEFGTGSQNICTDLGFSFQHHFQKLNNGNFLFFDNGNLSQIVRGTETPTSRIIEFEILNNMECNIICACDLPEPYYSASMGSVNLLDNGNYLINTRGDNGHIIEITSDCDIVWDAYLQTNLQESSFGNYRAFRIPSIHPEAFSVVFNSLEEINLEETSYPGVILSEENTLTIEIFNESGYTQDYQYIFNGEASSSWFDSVNNIISIEANESATLIFPVKYISIENLTEINFNVIPVNHEYAEKQFNFYVSSLVPSPISSFKFLKIYPNPFNTSSKIIFDVPYQSEVQVSIYNIKGQLLEKLLDRLLDGGRYILPWNAQNYSSGVYFIGMTSENFIETQKVTLIK